ncbi:MAG: YbaK/EbsC family protein [Gammaproteobacteria bacterium]
MPTKQLKEFLDKNHVKYISIDHSPSFTAQEIAAAAHISGKQLAKTVIVKAGSQFIMVVIPATEHVNFADLRDLTGTKEVDLAKEADFKGKFPECEPGAMPPFGNLYGMSVYVSNHLVEQDEIAFNAGTHSELLKMSFSDFERLVKPRVITMH